MLMILVVFLAIGVAGLMLQLQSKPPTLLTARRQGRRGSAPHKMSCWRLRLNVWKMR